ncbi:MAG: dephospho-coenzyme kinase [Deltaproteobacteria bacterium]|nr:dephospho-coenzyme kinase [Deltaproteobacteria bacterium]
MRVIGLTGGIASGKSTVARLLAGHGIPVIDADQLARDAVHPGTAALGQIAARFGERVLTPAGALDRTALAEIVFADPGARRTLEEILHPAIKSLAEQRLAELQRRGEPVAVYMAPLLIEAGAADRVDEIWVVYVDRETQLQRLVSRDGVSREGAEQRLAAQLPMDEKAAQGRIVIDNCGTPEMLEKRVAELCRAEFGVE